MPGEYFPPVHRKSSFHCPFCGVKASQRWDHVIMTQKYPTVIHDLSVSQCSHCSRQAYWYRELLIMPDRGTAPPPDPEMPESVTPTYEEAASIVSKSPRGAAALLRLAVQELCSHLGKSGKDLNDDIAELVAEGLRVEIQQSLDVVRVIGNNAVHPGVLDLKDDAETCTALFGLVNLIVDDRIAQPNRISALYSKLPQSSRDQIERRDAEEPAKGEGEG